MEQRHEQKSNLFEDILTRQEKEGYIAIVRDVEIRVRGFVESPLYKFLGQTGIKWCNKEKCIRHLIEIRENCSMSIWNKINIPWNNSK